jgi:hypothetical protein
MTPVRQNQTRSAVYGVIRHPSYLVLAFRSGVGLLITALIIPPLVAHPRERKAAAFTVRRRVRCLPRPDVTANSGPLLGA